MDVSTEEIIQRIGAQSQAEKKAWRDVISGITTIVFFRLKRKVAKRPSYYGGLTDSVIKARIKNGLVSFMLKVTDAVNSVCSDLDYPGPE